VLLQALIVLSLQEARLIIGNSAMKTSSALSIFGSVILFAADGEAASLRSSAAREVKKSKEQIHDESLAIVS